MKLPIAIANRLLTMTEENSSIPSSLMQGPIVQKMIEDGVLHKRQSGRTKALLFVHDVTALKAYLLNHFGIADLTKYVETLSSVELLRSDSVAVSGNSKLKAVRTFKGFLVNCYAPVQANLHDRPFVIQPSQGSFIFVYDYEDFVPDESVTIVGIENPENFRYVERQQHLFVNTEVLFVSRYPQSNDLLKWLASIPNQYLHFGDSDFAGINIYLNEYKRHLGAKAKFFIPANVEALINQYGNRELYNKQLSFATHAGDLEEEIKSLIQLFHKYKKVLEQEVFLFKGNEQA